MILSFFVFVPTMIRGIARPLIQWYKLIVHHSCISSQKITIKSDDFSFYTHEFSVKWPNINRISRFICFCISCQLLDSRSQSIEC